MCLALRLVCTFLLSSASHSLFEHRANLRCFCWGFLLVRFLHQGGANIALEVAKSQFCETTIGCPSVEDSSAWHAVFDTSMFRVHAIEDVSGVSLSGALKNIVAMAAGFVDGLDMGEFLPVHNPDPTQTSSPLLHA